jgi:hypothetical protein
MSSLCILITNPQSISFTRIWTSVQGLATVSQTELEITIYAPSRRFCAQLLGATEHFVAARRLCRPL